MAITDIFPIEDIRAGLFSKREIILEKIEKFIGDRLLEDNIENIQILDQDNKNGSNGRTVFGEFEKVYVQIYVINIKRDIEQVIQFSMKHDFYIEKLLKKEILELYVEFVLVHELIHVWQLSHIGYETFRKIKNIEKDIESIVAEHSYEVLADHIAKGYLISEYGDDGKLISNIAVAKHRYSNDEEVWESLNRNALS